MFFFKTKDDSIFFGRIFFPRFFFFFFFFCLQNRGAPYTQVRLIHRDLRYFMIHTFSVLMRLTSACVSSSMSCSMGKVLEVLVSLAQDRYDQVSSPSQAILRSMAKESLAVESRMLSELLEDNLHKLVTVLPRIIRTAGKGKMACV